MANAAFASSTAARACAASWTRPSARSLASSKLCTPIDSRVTPAVGDRRGSARARRCPGLASSVISQPGSSGRRARIAASSRSIDAGANRLGVPPPMKTRVHAPAPDERQRRLEVGDQRVDVARLGQRAGVVAPGVRIEVAVRALLQAPRQVHVERERRQRRQRQRAGTHEAGEALGDVAERARVGAATIGITHRRRWRGHRQRAARARLVSARRPHDVAQQREHPPAAWARWLSRFLRRRRRARRRCGRATAGRAAGRSRSRRCRAARRAARPASGRWRSSGSGSSAWRTRDERARRSARAGRRSAAQALEQAPRCWRASWRAPERLAVFARPALDRREVRRGDAGRAAERVDAEARVVGDRRAAGARAAWRALASAFSTKVRAARRPRRSPSAPCATSSMPSGANSACSSASLPGLFEARTSLTPRPAAARPSAARCAATSSPMPLPASASSASISARENGRALGRALQLDEAAGCRS